MTENHWNVVALSKLTAVLGEPAARELFDRGLSSLSVTQLSSPADLYRFSQFLIATGGFPGAVGGLLSVHATIHGAR